MPPGNFALDSEGAPLVERFDNTMLVTILGPYGAVGVTMSVKDARLLAEQLESQLNGAK